jgi:flagellar motor switch protein FliN/FliY
MANDTPNTESDEAVEDAPQAAENYSPDELENKSVSGDTGGADVNLELVLEVPVSVALQVGSAELPIRELVKLVSGSVIALDRESNESMDVLVNGKLIARGEIVVVDEQFGVRLTDVISPAERIEKIA